MATPFRGLRGVNGMRSTRSVVLRTGCWSRCTAVLGGPGQADLMDERGRVVEEQGAGPAGFTSNWVRRQRDTRGDAPVGCGLRRATAAEEMHGPLWHSGSHPPPDGALPVASPVTAPATAGAAAARSPWRPEVDVVRALVVAGRGGR